MVEGIWGSILELKGWGENGSAPKIQVDLSKLKSSTLILRYEKRIFSKRKGAGRYGKTHVGGGLLPYGADCGLVDKITCIPDDSTQFFLGNVTNMEGFTYGVRKERLKF